MGRGPKKHLKRVAAPSHWMLDKLNGVYAPRPSSGPHKLRECLPLVILLRNRLRYALTYDEARLILMQKLVLVDGKARTDHCYPAGFMDVIHIKRLNQNYRLLYDTKGRFVPQRIDEKEAQFKLCRVKKVIQGLKGVPCAVTHDGRTIRYIHPEIKANDTVQIDIESGKVESWIKFDTGNLVMITGGHNVGRVGVVMHRESHHGGFDIVHVKSSDGQQFATRLHNVFIIGKGDKPSVQLPKASGLRLSIQQEAALRFGN